MNSSETSAKYSCPNKEQKLDIQDSGAPEDVDMASAGERAQAIKRVCVVSRLSGLAGIRVSAVLSEEVAAVKGERSQAYGAGA